jgi:hypothetical protein
VQPMPRRPPEPPSDLPGEVSEAIAAMDLDQLRESTAQLFDLADARARRRIAPVPQRRRRRRAKEPFGVTVRVDLVGATPPVWRRLELPSTLRLDQLHGVLQAVFDWTDSHLHRFVLDDEAWGDGEKYLCPNDVEEGEDDGFPASDVRLDEVLAAPDDVLTYLYDYGDPAGAGRRRRWAQPPSAGGRHADRGRLGCARRRCSGASRAGLCRE